MFVYGIGRHIGLRIEFDRRQRIVGDNHIDPMPLAVIPDDGIRQRDRLSVFEIDFPGHTVPIIGRALRYGW